MSTTRRERLERKIAKREQWAESRRAEADRRLNTARSMASAIPLGQPILIGHHSEKRDRNYRGRIESNFSKGFESMNMAQHHESKAAGLAAQLETSIFSDDHDAIAALEARIAEREAEGVRMKLINKLYKKGDTAGLAALGIDLERLKVKLIEAGSYWGSKPHLPYELSNLGANIRRDKQRIVEIRKRHAQTEKAEAAPSGVLIETGAEVGQDWHGWCRVTFAEKPERAILNALREAGFRWGAGHLGGYAAKLPECVKELAQEPELCP